MQRAHSFSPRFRRCDFLSGIGIRVFVAFGIVSGITVLVGTFAFISSTQLSNTIDTLIAGTLPVMEASVDVAKKSSDIEAVAPTMLAAGTQADADVISKQIAGQQQRLLDAMAGLSSNEAAVASLTGLAAQMRQQLDTLTELVNRRFSLKTALGLAVGNITTAQRDITEGLAPWLDDAVFDLTMELSPKVDGGGIGLEDRLTHVREKEPALLALYDLRAESNRLTGLMIAAAVAPTQEMLTPLRDSATAASQKIARASTDLNWPGGRVELKATFAKLQASLGGDRTVFDLRGQELGVIKQAVAVLAANGMLAGKLRNLVEQEVRDKHTAAQSAAERGHSRIRFARRVLAAIATLSFLISLAVVWYFVGRRVVRRLSALASAMHQLAAGNTGIMIPGRSERDEIGSMAAALDVFRSHLIENRQMMADREQQLREAEENRHAMLIARQATHEASRLRQLSDCTLEGLLIHCDSKVLDANNAFCEMTGFDLAQVRGQPLARFAATWTDALDSSMPENGGQMSEINVLRANGESMPVEVRSRDIDYGGSPARVTALRDIRERRTAEDRIRFLAHYDLLTGLANRFQMNDVATREVALARRSGKLLAVLCLDLDRFKNVNDTFGHDIGDQLLKQVADRIRETARKTDIAARVGGDEFVLLQTALAQASDAAKLARRLISRLSEPYDINGQQVRIGASVGIAVHPRDGDQVDVLLKHADLALYRVKSQGRGDLCFFAEEMDTLHRERREMEQELAAAIRFGQMKLAFQPIFDTQSGEVVTFEALVRWMHPTRGVIPPLEFIPLAEKTNLIVPLGEWVLETACRAAMTWERPCRVAVNLSVRQFTGCDLPAMVAAVLDRTGLPGSRLELEVTESLLITDTERALLALAELRRLGIRIVLDDFGTGYSSLSYLQRFPFDKIKIDKSFIDGFPHKMEARTIVNAILAMSHQLNVEVTAEGIETSAQLALLRAEKCDEIQGYLLGRPMCSDRIGDYLSGACSVIEAEEQSHEDRIVPVTTRGNTAVCSRVLVAEQS